jgi:hypothetical protein
MTQHQTPRLTEALVTAQEEMIIVEKDAKGRFPYASLEGILRKVKPILSKNGLHISQTPGFFAINHGGTVNINTTIFHVSGESLELQPFTMPIEERHSNSIQQNIGTSITYARRYQLCGILNLGTDAQDPDAFDAFLDKNISIPDENKIKNALEKLGMDPIIVLEQFKVKALKDIPSHKLAAVMNFIKSQAK